MATQRPTQAGEPIIYHDKDIIPLECCDCGLVHWIMVDINGKEVILLLNILLVKLNLIFCYFRNLVSCKYVKPNNG